jgi:hypothetical protein
MEAMTKVAHGLSRVWQQMMGGSTFGIVSAASDSNKTSQRGVDENNLRHRELQSLLRKFEIGFVNMKGLWKNSEVQKYLPEKSAFMTNIREEDVRAVAQLYDQDSYIYGSGGNFAIKKTDGSMVYLQGRVADYLKQIPPDEASFMKQNPENATAPGMSVLKGRSWVFEEPNRVQLPQSETATV